MKRLLVNSLYLLVASLILTAAPTYAAAPAPGASCSGDVNGAIACYNNGCYVCTAGTWVTQPLFIGQQSATCTSTYNAQLRYNTSSNLIEYCDGSYWRSTLASSGDDYPGGSRKNGYFVVTTTTWDGNMGDITGIDAKCFTELTSTSADMNWLGKSTASANGQLVTGNIKGFACNAGFCNAPVAQTRYVFARVGNANVGGGWVMTDTGGKGPHFTGTGIWVGWNYFGRSFNFWSGRQNGSSTDLLWSNIPRDDINQCSSWSTNNSGSFGGAGRVMEQGSQRWANITYNCARKWPLICMVHPY